MIGRWVRSACVALRHSNRRDRACRRRVSLRLVITLTRAARVRFVMRRVGRGRITDTRRFTRRGRRGVNRFRWTGDLAPGAYRLTASPSVNPAAGARRTAGFAMVR
jgi:hypothetical protein